MMGESVFISWSGGKDSYLSLLKAKEQGLNIQFLLNFTGLHGRSMSHGIPDEIIEQQAAALGISLITKKVTWGSYQDGFLHAVKQLKDKGVTGGVFGDINIVEHKNWVRNMCSSLGLRAILPLWGMEEEDVVEELVKHGARLLIVSLAKTDLSIEWLGQEINEEFLQACRNAGISVCGEKGEYHTLVVGGPLFQTPLAVKNCGMFTADDKYFLKL